MPATYPAAGDLVNFLKAAGFADAAGDDFAALDPASKVQAAIDAWEEAVDWLPFLSPGVVQTRTYDPPGPPARRGDGFSSLRGGGTRLFLEAGLLTPPAITVAGIQYDAGYQYLVRPDNAAVKGKPYTWIEFLVPLLARMGDIAVSGVWGYSLSCPAQVWQAILQRAASLTAPELSFSISGGYFERKIGDSLKRFGGAGDSGPLTQQITLWDNNFNQCVKDKRRIAL